MRILIFTLFGASNAFSLTSWASAHKGAVRIAASTATMQEMRHAIFMLESPSVFCYWLFALKRRSTRNPDPKTALGNWGHLDRASHAGASAGRSGLYMSLHAPRRLRPVGIGDNRHTPSPA